jgi:hypothetical protein
MLFYTDRLMYLDVLLNVLLTTLYTQGAQSQQFQQEQQQQFAAPSSSSALLAMVTDMQKPALKQQLEARGQVQY